MTAKELVRKSSHKVRASESLMAFYLEVFEEEFGRKPNCAGCSFKTDWKRLKNRILVNKEKVMKNKKPLVKKSHLKKIITYKDKGRPVRSYGYNMSKEFAKAYLKSGGDEKIFKDAGSLKPKKEAKKEDPKAEKPKKDQPKKEAKKDTKKK